ncbi:DUF7210 family protein [Paenibacillus sp. FSL H8-0034]|uniref:DUF7210 family protein n=1 Tax=Paenibacillus sp. FSL H8-0034 TaxID=2954671 RepID=UPI0030FC4B01
MTTENNGKTNDPKAKPKTVKVTFNQNVKHRGEFHKAGTKLDVLEEDRDELLKDGVIQGARGESDDDN